MYTEMDESFKINNRWPSGPSDEGAQNVLTRYASGGGNEYSRQQVEGTRGGGETQKRFVSEVSYTSGYGDKFKKMKFNQMETLKELRQEYEILRESASAGRLPGPQSPQKREPVRLLEQPPAARARLSHFFIEAN